MEILSLKSRGLPSVEEFRSALINALDYWRNNRPRNYSTNKIVFDTLYQLAEEIAKEAREFFTIYPKRTTFTVVLFSNLGARWSRSEIVVQLRMHYLQPGNIVGRIMRGYKLDKIWRTQSEVAGKALEEKGVDVWW